MSVLLVAVFVAPLLFAGCASVSRPSTPEESRSEQTKQNVKVFDRVDRLVTTRHYSPAMVNARHWSELRETFRPQVAAAPDERSAYLLVNQMLSQLRDSHTIAYPPWLVCRDGVREAFLPSEAVSRHTESRVLDGGVIYLRFDHFGPESVRWLEQKLVAHHDAPAMIIDLRENCGGYVVSAQAAVGAFFERRMPMGIVVHRDGRETIEESRARRSDRYLGSLAVLVGPRSCSSAEVFASVVQWHSRGKLVGATTAGRVLGSEKFRLPDGGHLQLSTTGYRKLDGLPRVGSGVRPDVRVETTSGMSASSDGDPAISAALTILQTERAR